MRSHRFQGGDPVVQVVKRFPVIQLLHLGQSLPQAVNLRDDVADRLRDGCRGLGGCHGGLTEEVLRGREASLEVFEPGGGV